MKFNEFIESSQDKQAKPEGAIIDSAFGCQHFPCMEQADYAEYFRNEKFLRWTCPEGHESYIEDWEFG